MCTLIMESIFYFFKRMSDMSMSFFFFSPHCTTFSYQPFDSVGSMKYSEINETYFIHSVLGGVCVCMWDVCVCVCVCCPGWEPIVHLVLGMEHVGRSLSNLQKKE